MEEYQRLLIGVIASVIARIVLTLSWKSFLKDYRSQMILCNLFQMKIYM